jgi:Dolichyl-phosphate-mannose-protein mannosyltransferase
MHLHTRAIAAGIFLLFLLLACSQVLTKRPWVDEAWFAGAALDLATHGRLGTPVLDPAGSHLRLYKPDAVLTGIGEHTYWVMPLHLLQLAAWVSVFGFSVFTIRMPSVVWGLVTLASTGIIVQRLYGSSSAALIAMAVLAADFGFVDTAADGRMDMTCAGLGFAALAVYLSLRETNFQRALAVSHSLAAAALLTHPNGLLGGVALLLTVVYLDRGRWKPAALWPTVLPYLAGIGAWLLYALRSPFEFWAQFSANSAGRSNDLLMPWRGVWREITGRYLTHYWPSGSWPGKTKIIGLLFSVVAIAIVALSPQLRKAAGCRLLATLTAARFGLMSVVASAKFTYYMVYMIPYFAALAGLPRGIC